MPLFMADQVPKYVVFLFSACLWVQTCHGSTSKQTMAGDSLKPGHILNHTTQLCSATNIFCMDFDKIDDSSNFTYLRISYVSQKVSIWMGNRNKPVVNNSGALILDHNGSLKIVPKSEESKTIEVLYSPTQVTSNTVATLLDNGNFVLKELHTNGSTKTILWQSFDDHKRGHNWSLVSSVTDHNLASSEFKEQPRRFLFKDQDQKIRVTKHVKDVQNTGKEPEGSSHSHGHH